MRVKFLPLSLGPPDPLFIGQQLPGLTLLSDATLLRLALSGTLKTCKADYIDSLAGDANGRGVIVQ